MIQANLFPNMNTARGNYDGGNVQCTFTVPSVNTPTSPLPGMAFSSYTDAYWLGWIDVNNYPQPLRITEISFDPETELLSFKDATGDSEHHNFGYAITNNADNSYNAQSVRNAVYQWYDTMPFEGGYDTSWEAFTAGYYKNLRLLNSFPFQKCCRRYLTLTFISLLYASQDYPYERMTYNLTIKEFKDFLAGNKTISLTYNNHNYSFTGTDFNEDGYIKFSQDSDTGTPEADLFIASFEAPYVKNITEVTTSGNRTVTRLFGMSDMYVDDEKTLGYFFENNADGYRHLAQTSDLQFSLLTIAGGASGNQTYPFVNVSDTETAVMHCTSSSEKTVCRIMAGCNAVFDIKHIRENPNMYPFHNGNVFISQSGSGNNKLFYIWVAIKPTELWKYCGLFRWYFPFETYQASSAGNIEGYANNLVWYPEVNLDTNEFKCNLITGDESAILPKLTEWEKGNITPETSDYKPDDRPLIPPKSNDPSDKPVPDGKAEPKYSGDATFTSNIRVISADTSAIYYSLTPAQLSYFQYYLWSQPKGFYEAIQIAGKQQNSIFDFIQSLRYYPFDADAVFDSDGDTPVIMGTGATFKTTDDSDFQLHKLTRPVWEMLWCEWDLSDPDYHWRNNFLDYSPFTKITVYLPYAGTFDLDVQTVASETDIQNCVLKLYLSTDMISGAMTYYLVSNNTVVLTQTTQIGVDIPLTGNDSLRQALNITSNTIRTARTVIGETGTLVTNLATKNIAGLAEQAVTAGEMAINASVAGRQIPVNVLPASGTLTGISTCQQPFITVFRQKCANPNNYGHTTGYKTESTHTIRFLTGFTTARNPDLSGIPATDGEKELINQYLTTGFFA